MWINVEGEAAAAQFKPVQTCRELWVMLPSGVLNIKLQLISYVTPHDSSGWILWLRQITTSRFQVPVLHTWITKFSRLQSLDLLLFPVALITDPD